jgi:hypothetical protein
MAARLDFQGLFDDGGAWRAFLADAEQPIDADRLVGRNRSGSGPTGQ